MLLHGRCAETATVELKLLRARRLCGAWVGVCETSNDEQWPAIGGRKAEAAAAIVTIISVTAWHHETSPSRRRTGPIISTRVSRRHRSDLVVTLELNSSGRRH